MRAALWLRRSARRVSVQEQQPCLAINREWVSERALVSAPWLQVGTPLLSVLVELFCCRAIAQSWVLQLSGVLSGYVHAQRGCCMFQARLIFQVPLSAKGSSQLWVSLANNDPDVFWLFLLWFSIDYQNNLENNKCGLSENIYGRFSETLVVCARPWRPLQKSVPFVYST